MLYDAAGCSVAGGEVPQGNLLVMCSHQRCWTQEEEGIRVAEALVKRRWYRGKRVALKACRYGRSYDGETAAAVERASVPAPAMVITRLMSGFRFGRVRRPIMRALQRAFVT